MMATSRFGCSDRTARQLDPCLDSDDLALAVRPPGEMLLGEREPHIEADAEGREDQQSCEHKRHIEGGRRDHHHIANTAIGRDVSANTVPTKASVTATFSDA